MNLGDIFYSQFISGKLAAGSYIEILLKQKDNKVSKFLLKEFDKKKCKFSMEEFIKDGQTQIYKGQKHNWWLIDQQKSKGLQKDFVDYTVPLENNLVIVSLLKLPNKQDKTKEINDE